MSEVSWINRILIGRQKRGEEGVGFCQITFLFVKQISLTGMTERC